MRPVEYAHEKYRANELSVSRPIGLMEAVLEAYTAEATLRELVRAYVTAPPDSAERILAFNTLVATLGDP